MRKGKLKLVFFGLLGLSLLDGTVTPASAQNDLTVGDKVIVPLPTGQECGGVVLSINRNLDPILYSIKWTCSDGYESQGGFYREKIRKVSPINSSSNPSQRSSNANSNRSSNSSVNINPNSNSNSNRLPTISNSQTDGAGSAAGVCGQIGGKVEVLSGGAWYKATILEAGGGTYKISYDGFSSSEDERVTLDRIRPRGSTAVCGGTSTKYVDSFDYYVGNWELRQGGSITTSESNDKSYRDYSFTVTRRPPLTINADNTYLWADRTGKVLRGKWRPMTAQEDPYYGGKGGIVLLRALDGVDWNIKYDGIRDTKDLIQVDSTGSTGNFKGRRVGASKGKPAYTRQEHQIGDQVIVNYGGEECSGTVVDIIVRQTETLYRVDFRCRITSNTGNFAPSRIRRR